MTINEKKLKIILKRQRKEYQRYLGVLAKHFEDQVKVIAEILTNVQKQLSTLSEMVAKNTEDIEIMKMDIERMKMDINIIKQDLRRKVDRDEFEALEKRVLLLEKKSSR